MSAGQTINVFQMVDMKHVVMSSLMMTKMVYRTPMITASQCRTQIKKMKMKMDTAMRVMYA